MTAYALDGRLEEGAALIEQAALRDRGDAVGLAPRLHSPDRRADLPPGAPVRHRARPELPDGAGSGAEGQRGQLRPRRGLRRRRAEAWRDRADRAGHALPGARARTTRRRDDILSGAMEVQGARRPDHRRSARRRTTRSTSTSRWPTSARPAASSRRCRPSCSATTWRCCAATIPTSRATSPRASPSSSFKLHVSSSRLGGLAEFAVSEQGRAAGSPAWPGSWNQERGRVSVCPPTTTTL